MRKLKLEGQTFESLKVIGFQKTKGTKRLWRCKCECGKTVLVRTAHLRSGHTTSCGCTKPKKISDAKKTHGQNTGNSPEYRAWANMQQRCKNPKNPRYGDWGGRGIKVCARWNSFESFLADMGPKPSKALTIERRENDGPYSPDNCYWATQTQQNRNKRKRMARDH